MGGCVCTKKRNLVQSTVLTRNVLLVSTSGGKSFKKWTASVFLCAFLAVLEVFPFFSKKQFRAVSKIFFLFSARRTLPRVRKFPLTCHHFIKHLLTVVGTPIHYMATVVKCKVCGCRVAVPHGVDAEDCGMWRGCSKSHLMCAEHKLVAPIGENDDDDDARCPICTGAVAKVVSWFFTETLTLKSMYLKRSYCDMPVNCCS